jgi:hypothetical protein
MKVVYGGKLVFILFFVIIFIIDKILIFIGSMELFREEFMMPLLLIICGISMAIINLLDSALLSTEASMVSRTWLLF